MKAKVNCSTIQCCTDLHYHINKQQENNKDTHKGIWQLNETVTFKLGPEDLHEQSRSFPEAFNKMWYFTLLNIMYVPIFHMYIYIYIYIYTHTQISI